MSRIPSNTQQIELSMIREDARFFYDMVQQVMSQPSVNTLIFGYPPYISLFATESYNYLQQRIPQFAQLAQNQHSNITRSSRTMVKLFDEHLRDFTEIAEAIEWLIQYHNNWFMKNHKGLLGGLKRILQDDLGLYFYEKNLISTTHLAFFNVGFDRNNIEQYGNGFDQIMSTISREIGMITGEYIAILSTIFEIDMEEVRGKYFSYSLNNDHIGYTNSLGGHRKLGLHKVGVATE